MYARVLTVALLTAGTALAFATAHAQTSSSGSSYPSTTTPSTSGSSTMGAGSSSSSGASGSGSATSPQTAQQPMGSATFDISKFKTKTECLNAATAQNADRKLCDAVK